MKRVLVIYEMGVRNAMSYEASNNQTDSEDIELESINRDHRRMQGASP